MGLVIYGSSDDRVEVEGDVTEEFNCYNLDGYIAVSNGVLLSARYSNEGYWRFAVVKGHGRVSVTQASGLDGQDDAGLPAYSDKAVFKDPIEWVVLVDEPEKLIS